MNDTAGKLGIYYRNHLTGWLWLDERRRFVFEYETEWLKCSEVFQLSLSLPLRPEPYADDTARPFFANLLPEGEVRRLIARRLHISEENIYALLKAIGGDCAGAVSILPNQETLHQSTGYRELNEKDLHRLLIELPHKPLLAGDEGIRLSLAGAQNKLPVYMENDRISVARGNSPSTHILKPPMDGFKETVENEAFCMALARRMGLPAANAVIGKNRDTILIVTRYDRERKKDGTILRLHQEDFCQAMGTLPEQKYETEGGPSLIQCFELLKKYSIRPAVDQRSLLLWTIFNTLIGNADAHAKNISLLIVNPGPRLAPFYDLLSTAIYPNLAKKSAMKIGGENRIDWLQIRHWERFADSVALKPRYVLSMVRKMASKIAFEAEALARYFTEDSGRRKTVDKILGLIQKRSERWL